MKLWILTCSLSMALTAWGLAAHHQEERYYYLPEISEETLLEYFTNSPSSILVCPAGSTLPVSVMLNGDILSLELSEVSSITLKIKETLYLRLQNEQMIFSLDGTTWKDWLEMFVGEISIQLSVENAIPQLKLGAELNQRS